MSASNCFGDSDQTIHIPSRELSGTRESKLAELDSFLAQLQIVRLVLCGQPVRLEGFDGARADAAAGRDEPARGTSWVRHVQAVLGFRRARADRRGRRP